MTSYVALLRGVNLMGATVLRMSDLKAIAEKLGFNSVRTYHRQRQSAVRERKPKRRSNGRSKQA